MKKNKREFCELVASNLFAPTRAVEIIWPQDDLLDAQAKGMELMEDKKISKMIGRMRLDRKLMASPSKDWIKYKLMVIIEDAEKLSDFSSMRYCLDQLNKIDGNYDLSHAGVDGVNLTMQF